MHKEVSGMRRRRLHVAVSREELLEHVGADNAFDRQAVDVAANGVRNSSLADNAGASNGVLGRSHKIKMIETSWEWGEGGGGGWELQHVCARIASAFILAAGAAVLCGRARRGSRARAFTHFTR